MSRDIIQTARLALEPVTAAHAADMFAGLQDRRAYRYLPDEPPESVRALATRYRRLETGRSADGSELWLNWMLRVSETADFAGYIQATVTPAEQIVLIAYHLFPAFWRRDLAREAVAAMLHTIGPRYGLTEARAYIDTRNTASIRLVEALGFGLRDRIPDADFFRGERSDEYFYAKALSDACSRP